MSSEINIQLISFRFEYISVWNKKKYPEVPCRALETLTKALNITVSNQMIKS